MNEITHFAERSFKLRFLRTCSALSLLSILVFLPSEAGAQVQQFTHPSIEQWPRLPEPFQEFDWEERFMALDSFIFDWEKETEFPTIRLDTTHYNMESNTVFIPAYYGDERIKTDGYQDALTMMAFVVGSTLNGRDKDSVPVGEEIYDYVHMLNTFEHDYGNRRIFYAFPIPWHNRNHADWWYDLGPTLLYYMVGDLYPDQPGMDRRLRDIADALYEMIAQLGGPEANFWHQSYNFDMMRPVNCITWGETTAGWKCPEIGILTAAIEYWAYQKFGDPRYLQAAKWSMDYYEDLEKNPYYEIALSLGPYIASRLNAELGTNYDTTKYFDWLLKGSDVRQGYGTAEANWNGYDVYGLVGSRKDMGGEGYVFGLETFVNAFLAPAVKYNPALARTAGKWLLNASNAARFFYADQLPAEHQYYGQKYRSAPEHVIPYEGLRISEEGVSPRATGDAVAYHDIWASYGHTFDVGEEATNLSIYGGAWAGFFGAILENTDVPGILQIDLNKLDFYQEESYPSFLYYNPYQQVKKVTLELDSRSDLFDAITGKVLARNVSGNQKIKVPADGVISLVILPPNSKIETEGGKMKVAGIPITYRNTIE